MCESAAYILKEDGMERIMDNVVSVDPFEGKVYLTDLLGEQKIVDGEIKEYDILITQVNLWSGEVNKSMTIEVTDPSLLDETGGIIQGMSGSPILQNGKLIGAVTHVFVNNPTKGYGIFAESMINESEEKIPCREVIELSDSNFLIRKKEKIIIKSNEK